MHRHNSLCGADCAYRRLYEGSQSSLADMATKQAGALNRVSRLRSGIIGVLKQTFPTEFAAAEIQLSRRMSTVDDEVLLAYLTGFLALPTRRHVAPGTPAPTPVGADDLRDELDALGVRVPQSDDLRAWAAAVATWSEHGAPSAPVPGAAVPAVPVPEPAAPPVGSSVPESPGPKARRRTGAKGLGATGSLPGDVPSAGFAPGSVPDEIPWGDDPGPDYDPGAGHIGAEAFVWDDELTPPTSDVADHAQDPAHAAAATVTGPGDAGADDELGDLEDLFGPDDLSSLFEDELGDDADDLVEALYGVGRRDAVELSAEPSAEPGLPEGTPPAPAEPAVTVAGPGTVAPPVAPETAQSAAAETTVSTVSTVSTGQAEAFPTPPTGAGLTAPAASAHASGSTSSNTAHTNGMSLRPELFPSAQIPKGGKAARRGRTSRVSAAPPDPRGLDVPMSQDAGGDDLTDELFNQLIASVCIPRPVFISDLVAQVGSDELVKAWEKRCRDMGTASPVRFIAPKPRHRERGALIIPHSPDLRQAANEFTRSWWATCLDERRLRGAHLYETAVLLHRFGESVISSRIEGDVVVLRVNQPRGLVGVAVALETDFSAGSASRAQIADAVGELLTDRLTLVAALTYAAAGGALENLSTAIREESVARGWKTTTPVIASLSWDFANDGGSSALSVL